MTNNKLVKVARFIEADGMSVTDACRTAGISRQTYYNHRDQLGLDARVKLMRDSVGRKVDSDIEKILDTQQERSIDLGILNHLLGRLVDGIENGHWCPLMRRSADWWAL